MMKKVLFIDRDGTIILEPKSDFQVDHISKFRFYPRALYYLSKIYNELDYKFVLVTNQDGLGTSSFPENDFWPLQDLMMDTLVSEGIVFDEVFIDRSFEKDNSPNRKPNTGMLTRYLNGEYNLDSSYVIGDRYSDAQLAQNLGCHSIFIHENFENSLDEVSIPDFAKLKTQKWKDIYDYLKKQDRKVKIKRVTNETKVDIKLNLDGSGFHEISTGLAFFDHMLEQLAKHGNIDIFLYTDGDLEIDEHHTIEDTGIALGQAFLEGLEKKIGIQRYGFCLPMDDCFATVALDFGGRPWLVWDVEFKREKVGDVPTEMIYHFFKSFCDHAKCNAYISCNGDNEHHKIESIFKAFARAIKLAKYRDINDTKIPSTKGLL